MTEQGEAGNSLAGIVEARRKELGWNKRVAAERCGLVYTSFVDITTGRTKSPPPETLMALSTGLGMDLRLLLEATGWAPILKLLEFEHDQE